MTKEEEQMYELFMQPGWQRFQSEMTEALDALRAGYDSCNTVEKFFKQQGMVRSLANVVAYEQVYRAQVENDD